MSRIPRGVAPRAAVAFRIVLPILVLAAPPAAEHRVRAATTPAPAATPPAPAAKPPAALKCAAPEHRQFDFWLGDWVVTDPQGETQGTNSVTSLLGGCVVQEHWRGAEGMEGTSLNIYDRSEGRWHQTWVDDRGLRLDLAGGLRDRSKGLEGADRKSPRGGTVRDRITWTPLEGGRVRQLWEQSKDGGKTWAVGFDGTYAPRGA